MSVKVLMFMCMAVMVIMFDSHCNDEYYSDGGNGNYYEYYYYGDNDDGNEKNQQHRTIIRMLT